MSYEEDEDVMEGGFRMGDEEPLEGIPEDDLDLGVEGEEDPEDRYH